MMEKTQINESKFYERNLAVFGHTTHNKLRNMSIIIVNLNTVYFFYFRSDWK